MNKKLWILLAVVVIAIPCTLLAGRFEELTVSNLWITGAKNQAGVTVLVKDPNGKALLASGTSVPSGTAGYAMGGEFIKTNASGGAGIVYVNTGSATSSKFTAVSPAFALHSSATSLSVANKVVECRRATTLMVPKTTGIAGHRLTVVKSDATGKCFLNVTGTGQISGFTTYTSVGTQYESVDITAGVGTGWHVTGTSGGTLP